MIVEHTNGATFPDGDAWKCLTCGVTIPSGVDAGDFTYPPPHALPGDKKVLVGNGILQCTNSAGALVVVTDPQCTASTTTIYPIYWGTGPLGGPGGIEGNGREWRLSPDGVHLEWDTLISNDGNIGEDEFEGTLSWDAVNNHYDLTHVYFLPQPNQGWIVKDNPKKGKELVFQPEAMIGEARGWTSDGKSILGIQAYEDNSVDAWATNLTTSKATPLTVHAQYTDPMFMSPNGKYMVNLEDAGSGHLDFISGLEGISPIAGNLLTVGDVSGMRNAGHRHFFQPWVTSTSQPLTEQVNIGPSNADWAASTDPVWTADSKAVVYAQSYTCVTACTGSSEPGGRDTRLMIARLGLKPSKALPPVPISDTAPKSWAIPYTQGQTLPPANIIPTGTYTLSGDMAGSATVVVKDNASSTAIQSMDITFHGYEQTQGKNVINGTQDITVIGSGLSADLRWNDNLTAKGLQGSGTLVTSPDGFTVNSFDLEENSNLQATGTMTTTLNGVTYKQPANGD